VKFWIDYFSTIASVLAQPSSKQFGITTVQTTKQSSIKSMIATIAYLHRNQSLLQSMLYVKHCKSL